MKDFENPAAIEESKALVKGFIPPSQKFSKNEFHFTTPCRVQGQGNGSES
jgi:hypothetical protein